MARMHTYGQLIHVEELHIGLVHYRIAVFREQGGLHGTWSCDTCPAHSSPDNPCQPIIEECVAYTKRAIEQHHRVNHAGV